MAIGTVVQMRANRAVIRSRFDLVLCEVEDGQLEVGDRLRGWLDDNGDAWVERQNRGSGLVRIFVREVDASQASADAFIVDK